MHLFKKVALLFFLFIFTSDGLFAQSIKVISYPDLKPLPNVNVILDGKNIGNTDLNGLFLNTIKKGEISLSYLGYITQSFPKPKSDTSIFLLQAEILLAEVIINPPKEKILGYFGKWGNGVIQGKSEFNSSIVNSVTILTPSTLKSFLFYIPKYQDSKINVPFEFVIFKEVNGKYLTITAFEPIRIEQYDFLWNSFSLASYNLSLAPGNYLFGMRWIKSSINERKKDHAIRQTLGTINQGNSTVNSYRSVPNKGWQLLKNEKDGHTSFSVALLGLIIEQ